MKKAFVRNVIFNTVFSLVAGVLTYALRGNPQFAMRFAAGLFVGLFLGDLINRLIPWKKIQMAFLQKRIKRMESEVALYEDECPEDVEGGFPPNPFLSKKRKKLRELRLKLDDLK